MKVICAGQSDAGMEFSAKYADFNFCFGKGVNTPDGCGLTRQSFMVKKSPLKSLLPVPHRSRRTCT
jgi:hypothetical protein